MEKSKLARMVFVAGYDTNSDSRVNRPSSGPSKSDVTPPEMLRATLAPRELADSEVDAMWARYPGLRFEDFFLAGESA